MRFFKKELWEQMNQADHAIRTAAEKEWMLNAEEYLKEFEIVKNKLPSSFIDLLSERDDFHDYIINRIVFKTTRNNYTCELVLSRGVESISLEMINVKKFRADFLSFRSCVCERLAWGYSEFRLLPNGNILMSILCDMDNEMEVEFQEIRVKEKSRNTDKLLKVNREK